MPTERGKKIKGRRLFGNYILTRHLWREGDFIEIFEAVQTLTDAEVEIRIMKVPLNDTKGLSERFLHETKLLARMEHPSIVRVLDMGVEKNRAYYTTPLRPSVRLIEYLENQGGRLVVADALRLGEILTDALCLMHGQGLLHRGINAKSVYVDTDGGTPYFGECSLLKDLREQSTLSQQGVPLLSEINVVPEIVSKVPRDERTDIYQMCSLIFRMLTGRRALPHHIAEEFAQTFRRLTKTPPPSHILAGMGDLGGLDKVILKGLEWDPGKRFQSAEELADELERLARKRDLKLFLRSQARQAAAAVHPRSKMPREATRKRKSRRQKTAGGKAGGKRDKALFWLGLSAGLSFGLGGFLLYVLGGDRPAPDRKHPGKRPPRASAGVEKKGDSASADKGLLAALNAADGISSEAERFKLQYKALVSWVRHRKKLPEGVGNYVELLKIRAAYAHGDTKALSRFKKMLVAARKSIVDTGGGR